MKVSTHRNPPNFDGQDRATAWRIVTILWILALVPNNAAPQRTVLVATVFVLGITVHWMLRYRVAVDFSRPIGALLLLFGPIAFASALSPSGLHGALGPLQMASLLCCVALASSRLSTSGITLVYKGIVALAVVESLIAIEQKTSGRLKMWGWVGVSNGTATYGENLFWPGGRALGTLGHGILLGTVAVVGLIVLLATPEFGGVFARVVPAGILLAGLLASGSRSPVIVGVAAALFAIYTQRSFVSSGAVRLLAPFPVAASLLVVDVRHLTLVESLRGTDSLINRVSSWSLLAQAEQLPRVDQILGRGWDVAAILRPGGAAASVAAIDNNWVTTYLMGGVGAFLGLVWLIFAGLRAGDATSRSCIVFLVGMFLSFDLIAWSLPMAMLTCFCAIERKGRSDDGRLVKSEKEALPRPAS